MRPSGYRETFPAMGPSTMQASAAVPPVPQTLSAAPMTYSRVRPLMKRTRLPGTGATPLDNWTKGGSVAARLRVDWKPWGKVYKGIGFPESWARTRKVKATSELRKRKEPAATVAVYLAPPRSAGY